MTSTESVWDTTELLDDIVFDDIEDSVTALLESTDTLGIETTSTSTESETATHTTNKPDKSKSVHATASQKKRAFPNVLGWIPVILVALITVAGLLARAKKTKKVEPAYRGKNERYNQHKDNKDEQLNIISLRGK
jgi:hypothetical protein